MNFTEKTWETLLGYGKELLLAVLVLIAGLILTKLILKVARKVLDKSSIDESVYKFLLNTLKYAAYVVIFVVVLRCITYEDCMLLPKGEKIAKILHIKQKT